MTIQYNYAQHWQFTRDLQGVYSMLPLLSAAVSNTVRSLVESEEPVRELTIDPVTALWITLLIIVFVSIFIIINATKTQDQVAVYGLDQPNGDSAHGEHH